MIIAIVFEFQISHMVEGFIFIRSHEHPQDLMVDKMVPEYIIKVGAKRGNDIPGIHIIHEQLVLEKIF